MAAIFLLNGMLGAVPPDPVSAAQLHLEQEIARSSGFRQVRAAEYLGKSQPDFPLNAQNPAERIGQARVRAAAGDNACAEFIRRAVLDPAFAARAHALESAAKLHLRFSEKEQENLRLIADSGPSGGNTYYARWLLADQGDIRAASQLTAALAAPGENNAKVSAAYAAGFLPTPNAIREKALLKTAQNLTTQSGVFAAWSLAKHGKFSPEPLRRILRTKQNVPEKIIRFQLLALGECGDSGDYSLLASFLHYPEIECANAAACAILAISRR